MRVHSACRHAAWWIGVLVLAGWMHGSARADRATIVINTRVPGPRVSPTLWGIFFEEINHAGDGGLYAELVRNRSFEDGPEPEGWSLVAEGGSEGRMVLDTPVPPNGKNGHSLRLDAIQVQPGRLGVANAGYWGIAVSRGRRYVLSLYARADDGFRGDIGATLESAAGQVYAQARLGRPGSAWQKFTAVLTPARTDAAARLVLTLSRPGTVWLDVVSLFPEATWKRRANGLRPDLAQMLADLGPAFVRFPGGCFVEGDQLANAFRWKETIGDIAARPGHWNLWGYRSSDGLGYHEYLQMCEDLGAEPLFVVNCGMAHGGVVPMDQLDAWVQDALDAVEYANSPPTSRWGALRARNGHPAPFRLKYVEIGNENSGPAYEERYARFYDALKQRYPEVRLIANVPVTSRPMDILDEHYYSSPEWFASQASRYDRYDRKGPRIYVGEFACTQGCGQGNLRAALGEAAFMTGIERNSDIVAMASYAPLFVNTHNRAWNPDAIVFDSHACYGTPSYYVQQLFARHRPDVVLPARVESTAPVPAPSGAIGLSTWRTQAEFADVKVTRGSEVLFADDFRRGTARWRVVRGEWAAQDGVLRQTALGEDQRAIAGDPSWTDITLSLRARKLGGAEGFLILFRVRDDQNWLWWNLGGWNNVSHAIEKCSGGMKSIVSQQVPGRIETGRWYDIRIETQGPRIRCFLDGRLVHEIEDRGPQPLYAVAGRLDTSREIILKVVNFSPVAQDTEVVLDGVRALAPGMTATVLTSSSPDDENSFSQPKRVAPVTVRRSGIAPRFRYTFRPWSLTLLRLRERR